jgi:two-component system, chemotaxis family, response regulator WspR
VSILIVDDQAERLSALETQLTRVRRWNIVAAGSVTDAVRMVEGGGVELVLTDLMGPGMRALDLCVQIQKREGLRHIPVVMLIEAEDRERLERIYAAGACDYLIKPLNLEEAVARVRAVLKSREEISQRAARERRLEAANLKLAAENRELLRLATADPVTGVANRRSFDQMMERLWRSGARQNREVALVMIDVDFFKGYNDRLGHPAGDGCLKRVAGALATAVMRPDDFLARYGGEEFAVILPQTHMDGACVVAERLRASVQALGIEHPGSPVAGHVTISQGVACQIPERGSDCARLIALADQALYEAKKSGRNRVHAVAGEGRSGLSAFAAGQSHNRTHELDGAPLFLHKL